MEEELRSEASDEVANKTVQSSTVSESVPHDDDEESKSVFSEDIRSVFNYDEIKDLLTNFHRYQDGNNFMSVDLVKLFVRSEGYDTTQSYLNECIEEVDIDNIGEFNDIMYLKLITKLAEKQITEEELLNSFQSLFDTEQTGSIKIKSFEAIITVMGERLDKYELDDLVKMGDLPKKGQKIYYKELIKRMNVTNHLKDIETRRIYSAKLRSEYEKKVRLKKIKDTKENNINK